jgi:hypothetical protein
MLTSAWTKLARPVSAAVSPSYVTRYLRILAADPVDPICGEVSEMILGVLARFCIALW